jgi:hypothetical protein
MQRDNSHAMQRSGKYVYTNGVTVGNGIFHSLSERGCKEDNWGNPVSWELSSVRQDVKILRECVKLKNLHY